MKNNQKYYNMKIFLNNQGFPENTVEVVELCLLGAGTHGERCMKWMKGLTAACSQRKGRHRWRQAHMTGHDVPGWATAVVDWGRKQERMGNGRESLAKADRACFRVRSGWWFKEGPPSTQVLSTRSPSVDLFRKDEEVWSCWWSMTLGMGFGIPKAHAFSSPRPSLPHAYRSGCNSL